MEFSEATKILILLSNNFDENSLPVTPAKLRNIIAIINEKDISLTELTSQNHQENQENLSQEVNTNEEENK